MKVYLIDDEEKFMKRLARKAFRDHLMTEDDKELQRRMQLENAAIQAQSFLDMLNKIHSNHEKPADYNKRMAKEKGKVIA